jgi:hypothetical protein
MAKISANGDEAVRAWKHADGRRLVLTRKGRLLGNWLKGDKLTIRAKNVSETAAREYARRNDFTEAKA